MGKFSYSDFDPKRLSQNQRVEMHIFTLLKSQMHTWKWSVHLLVEDCTSWVGRGSS